MNKSANISFTLNFGGQGGVTIKQRNHYLTALGFAGYDILNLTSIGRYHHAIYYNRIHLGETAT